MPLFSSSSRSSYGYRSRRKSSPIKQLLAVLAVLLIIAGLGYAFWPADETPVQPVQPVNNGGIDMASEEGTVGGEGTTDEGQPLQPGTPDQQEKQEKPKQPAVVTTDNGTSQIIEQGIQLVQAKEYLKAREMFNKLYYSNKLSALDRVKVRTQLMNINKVLFFSPRVARQDPLSALHPVKPGDRLSKIASKHDVTWQLLCTLNGISDPGKLRAGRTIKVVNGPFHLDVHKRSFRADLYAKTDQGKIYIYSFHVGLGKHDSTPEGSYVVRKNSKLVNPSWVNPRTGEKFSGNDPDNPIGKFWIGLRGTDEMTSQLDGYGIHGTNEPESIGKQQSMGCIRMGAEDVELIYSLLIEGKSTVQVHR